jgi:uncharacterized protein YtpQ (UPF0354 family)
MNLSLAIPLLLLAAGCSNPDTNTAADFTREYADALHAASPLLKVTVVDDLKLKVSRSGGSESDIFLDNAYKTCMQDTSSKADVMARYIAADVEVFAADGKKTIDPARLVPVVKDTQTVADYRRMLRSRGTPEEAEIATEEFADGLVIAYAEDSPSNIRFVSTHLLDSLGIERQGLRELAITNLQRLLPPLDISGGKGLYMVQADGSYEASLLLLDSLWNTRTFDVHGDIVVAIPTRSLLLVTGSRDAFGLSRLREYVNKAFAEGAYLVTQQLYVYRDKKFIPFDEGG